MSRCLLVVLGLLATLAACHAGKAVPALKNLELDKDVSVKVDYEERFDWVEFHMCDDKNCATMWFIRPPKNDADKDFVTVFSPCGNKNNLGDCNAMIKEAKGIERFSSGPLEFVVRRTSSKLLVWLKAHSNNKAEMPIQASFNKLRVAPSDSTDALPVSFDGVKA